MRRERGVLRRSLLSLLQLLTRGSTNPESFFTSCDSSKNLSRSEQSAGLHRTDWPYRVS